MSLKPANGTGLRNHVVRYRFAPLEKQGRRPGSSLLDGRVAEIRKILRTDQTIEQIAAHFGVSDQCLRAFIKRRRICDLTARRDFIKLQKSVAKLPEPAE